MFVTQSELRDHQLEPFVFGCSLAVFPQEEIDALSACGSVLEALAAGKISPATPEQQHFIRVDREEAEAESIVERAWVRLRGRREYEAEEKGTSAPSKQEDYGMVEFDADRCWW